MKMNEDDKAVVKFLLICFVVFWVGFFIGFFGGRAKKQKLPPTPKSTVLSTESYPMAGFDEELYVIKWITPEGRYYEITTDSKGEKETILEALR